MAQKSQLARRRSEGLLSSSTHESSPFQRAVWDGRSGSGRDRPPPTRATRSSATPRPTRPTPTAITPPMLARVTGSPGLPQSAGSSHGAVASLSRLGLRRRSLPSGLRCREAHRLGLTGRHRQRLRVDDAGCEVHGHAGPRRAWPSTTRSTATARMASMSARKRRWPPRVSALGHGGGTAHGAGRRRQALSSGASLVCHAPYTVRHRHFSGSAVGPVGRRPEQEPTRGRAIPPAKR